MNKSELKAKATELGKLFKVNPTEDNLTYQEDGAAVYQIKEKELASAILKAKRIKDFEKYGIDDAEWDLDDGYIVFMKGDNAIYFSAVVDMEMNESAMNEGTPSKDEGRKLAAKYAKFLGIAHKETDDTWGGDGAIFKISVKGFVNAVKKIRTTQGAKQLPVDKMKVFTTGAVVEKLNVDEVEIADNEGYIRFTKGTKDVYLQTDWAEDDKELLAESNEMNEALTNERDFALAIMKRLGIKGKQIGRTNVFEVSGSDRMKIDKLKPNDELGKVIIFGVEDNEYSTDLEVKTYLMPKRLTEIGRAHV